MSVEQWWARRVARQEREIQARLRRMREHAELLAAYPREWRRRIGLGMGLSEQQCRAARAWLDIHGVEMMESDPGIPGAQWCPAARGDA